MSKYDDLVGKINKAKEDYYQNGRSMLTDQEYDALLAEAEKMGYEETIGAAPVDSIEKIKHEHPMLSLDKIHSKFEVKKFIMDKQCLVMYKADGLTISATYQDGILTRLETRGDGEIGNNIMHHANSIINLPKTIDHIGKYVIDGECVILKSDFDAINTNGEYKNPRNLAAGSLNLLDGAESAKRYLRFYAWDVIEGGSTNSLCSNLVEAGYLGFDTVYMTLFYGDETVNEIEKYLEYIKNKANYEGFPIDGVVIKYDDIQYNKSLGMTEHHPLGAIAYKYQDEIYVTKLKEVVWQVGKTGQITPVALFDPVVIDSTVVERASLHNLSIMKSLGLTNGCTVYVKKCNQIIPQVDLAEPDGDGQIIIPRNCPICGGLTRIAKDSETETLYCTNELCAGKLLGLWKTFVSKKAMDIDGLSEQTLALLLKLGYIDNMFESIYHLSGSKNELYKLDGFGKRSVDKLLASIEASKDCTLQKFIVAFSIPGIGTGQTKLICSKFHTFEEFAKACDDLYDFSQIPGIGTILSHNIHKWWMLNHMQMMDIASIVRFQNNEVMNAPTGNYPLSGKTFVITGKVNHFANRDELKQKIESLGGKVAGSVSKNTDYLINNDTTSTSGKNKRAKELNIPIISEENLLDMIG